MTPAIYAAYAQLLSLGFLFIGFHCVGMCGPILCGLQISNQRFGLLFYQLGRSSIYLTLGGLAGLLGAALEVYFARAGAILSISFGALILFQTVYRYSFPVQSFGKKLAILQPQEFGLLRPLFFGVCLGFMPCMITIWALGIAATTASVMHGSLIMLLLVAMTTPALWLATRIPKLLGSIQRFQSLKRLAPIFIGLSGIWLIFVGLAGLDLISHQHLHFDLFGKTYMIMFY